MTSPDAPEDLPKRRDTERSIDKQPARMAAPSPATSPAMVPARRLGAVPGLDGMRGIAVLIVFVSHLEVILPIPTLLVIPGGTVSLDSFFVLSGFLITALMLREQSRTGKVGKAAFYQRRALRLLPALFVVLIFQAVFAYLEGISFHEEWTSLLSVAFYYSNWKLAFNSNALGGNIANGLQQMWSLSFEEQFYLIWPWVTIFALTVRRSLRSVAIALFVVMVIIDVHMAMMYRGLGSWYADFVRTDTRAGSILIGCLLAHVWIRGREPKRYLTQTAWIAALFLLICLPLAGTTGPFLYRGGLVAIDAACAVLILAIVDGRWLGRRFFEWRPLVLMGMISYGFYLWHLPIFFAIRYYGTHWNDVVRVVVAVVATFALSITSFFVVERPFMRRKNRLSAAQPGRQPEAQPSVSRAITPPTAIADGPV
ncbi:MAG: acyltransferase family protein [Acidimicrobiales bacterium]